MLAKVGTSFLSFFFLSFLLCLLFSSFFLSFFLSFSPLLSSPVFDEWLWLLFDSPPFPYCPGRRFHRFLVPISVTTTLSLSVVLSFQCLFPCLVFPPKK